MTTTASQLISLNLSDRQWTFVMRVNESDRTYRTNTNGEGLWLYQNPSWTPIKNEQFSLPTDKEEAIAAITKLWATDA